MLAWLKSGAIGALAGAALGFGAGYQWRDGTAAKADLERERAAAAQMAALQQGMDRAALETEKRLALAARNLATARADADVVRDLASRVRASDQASERDRERIRVLSGLVAESARLLEEGEGIAGRLDARHAGCAMTP